MANTLKDRTLALAAILQPLDQVQTIARQGKYDTAILETSVNSILDTRPSSVMALFGNVQALERGLKLLLQQFEKEAEEASKELLHYFVGINQLQKKMTKDSARLEKITEGIVATQRKLQHFPLTHDSIIARLADIYSSTVSDLSPRIIVQGEQAYLSNTAHINRVRTLLLAAIRATVLWRQCGGGHIKLLFERKNMLKAAQQMLSEYS